jgi:hypothetical protein
MLWKAVVWVIWRVRNDLIFAQKSQMFKRRSKRLNACLGIGYGEEIALSVLVL